MNLPILSALQWWIVGAILAAAFATGSAVGYKTGVVVQGSRDAQVMRDAANAANARATAAEAQRDAQAAQYKKELAERDASAKLASQLFDDLREHAIASDRSLATLRTKLREANNDPRTKAIMGTAIPSDVRRVVCEQRGETCD